jgi:signal recognition particle subunit SRP54
MRHEEIENPKMIDSSRTRRIARGSGKSERDVKELLSQHATMRRMMKSMRRQQSKLIRRLPFQT